jgi:hypothetical protein
MLPSHLPRLHHLQLLEAYLEDLGTPTRQVLPLALGPGPMLDRGTAGTSGFTAPPQMPAMRPAAGDDAPPPHHLPLLEGSVV